MPPLTFESIAERLHCVPRFVRAQNRSLGSPLDQDELADVAQDALVVVWRRLSDFRPGTSLEAWVYRICYLQLRGLQARKARRDRVRDGLEADELPARESDELLDPWMLEELRVGMRDLSAERRSLLELRHFQGLTFEAMATHLDVPLGTIKSRYYRALSDLSRRLPSLRPVE
ncbi:MAG: sigma-70 family RNA polymerase sigma factor [Planctomycetota bacterium]